MQTATKVDEHRSEVICRFPEDGEYAYHQTSRFMWADGRIEVREFPTRLQGDRLILSGIIEGWAAEVSLDEHQRTVMLYWRRQEHSELYLYEMIQISDCSRYRNRVWQWFTDEGRLARRTLIDEHKVSQGLSLGLARRGQTTLPASARAVRLAALLPTVMKARTASAQCKFHCL